MTVVYESSIEIVTIGINKISAIDFYLALDVFYRGVITA